MMCQSRCTFVAGSSDHHFDSNNYPQQSYRAVDLHRLEASSSGDHNIFLPFSTSFEAWPSLKPASLWVMELLIQTWCFYWSTWSDVLPVCCCSKLEIPVVISSGPSKELYPATLWYNLCESWQSTLRVEHRPTGIYLGISFCPWQVEDSLSSLSLQINVPVLSLTLTLMLLLGITVLLLGLKRMSKLVLWGVHQICLWIYLGSDTCCQWYMLLFFSPGGTHRGFKSSWWVQHGHCTIICDAVTEYIVRSFRIITLNESHPKVEKETGPKRNNLRVAIYHGGYSWIIWHKCERYESQTTTNALHLFEIFTTVCPLKNPVTSSMRSGWGGQFKRTYTRWTKACRTNVKTKKYIQIDAYSINFNKPMPQTKTMCCFLINTEHKKYTNKSQLALNSPNPSCNLAPRIG